MRPDGANSPAGKGISDERLGCFAGVATILVSGCNSVCDLDDLIRRGRTSEATQPDDDVLRHMDDRKTVFPRVSVGRAVQTYQKIRGDFRSCEKVSDAVSDSRTEAVLENVRSFEECT